MFIESKKCVCFRISVVLNEVVCLSLCFARIRVYPFPQIRIFERSKLQKRVLHTTRKSAQIRDLAHNIRSESLVHVCRVTIWYRIRGCSLKDVHRNVTHQLSPALAQPGNLEPKRRETKPRVTLHLSSAKTNKRRIRGERTENEKCTAKEAEAPCCRAQTSTASLPLLR